MAEQTLIHLGDGLYEEAEVKGDEKIVINETSKDRFGKTMTGTLMKEGEAFLCS